MRLPVEKSLPLAVLTLLAACGGGTGLESAPAVPQSSNGPAGDYPVVVGPAYSAGGVNFTPVDTMNYDVVGRASIGSEGASTITAAHHTLPLPSYVEVTALDTGKTILVRVERRGPMNASNLIELSPGAAAQLGLAGAAQAAVRVRRVNPVEPERALLRAGQPAPARIDTPKSLLSVLQRKLDQQEGVVHPAPEAVPAAASTPGPASGPAQAKPVKPTGAKPAKPVSAPAPTPVPAPAPAATPAPKPASAAHGRFMVQVGAFSNEANARAAAAKTGGSVVQSGKFWRVRIGPLASEAEAKAALAKAKAAGFGDARIQTAN